VGALGDDLPPQLLGRKAALRRRTWTARSPPRQREPGIYGDFSNYVIADRIGMTVEFIPHLVGANRRPTGQRGWYAYYRVGADSVNDGAFRMLNVT
jgi:HK97 family phage major capsid protein